MSTRTCGNLDHTIAASNIFVGNRVPETHHSAFNKMPCWAILNHVESFWAIWVWVKTYGTIFGWMNLHLPSILMFTTTVLTHGHIHSYSVYSICYQMTARSSPQQPAGGPCIYRVDQPSSSTNAKVPSWPPKMKTWADKNPMIDVKFSLISF